MKRKHLPFTLLGMFHAAALSAWGQVPSGLPSPAEVITETRGLTSYDALGDSDKDVTFRARIDFEAKANGEREVIFETGGGTIGLSLTYEAESKLVLRASGNGGLILTIAEATLTADQLAAGPLELLWIYDVMDADGASAIAIYLDGELAASAADPELGADWSGTDAGAFGVASASMAGNGDNTTISGIDFASGTIDTAYGLHYFPATLFRLDATDGDGDGIDDDYEITLVEDLDTLGADNDIDGDGLNDVDEARLGTNPTEADTDGDGLGDGAETTTGVFVSVDDAGTNPFTADSDGDSLTDGEEADGGTDPNNGDSDGDGFSDGFEVAQGSDPNDAASLPDDLLGAPTLEVNTLGQFTTLQSNGWDTKDATFRVSIDFEAKADGNPEVIFESGGGTVGLSLVYEATNKLVIRQAGNGGIDIGTLEYVLTDEQIAAGDLELIFTTQIDNGEGLQVLRLFIEGAEVAALTAALQADWTGANASALGTATSTVAAGGNNTGLPDTVDFTSGTINTEKGFQFFSDKLYEVEDVTPPAEFTQLWLLGDDTNGNQAEFSQEQGTDEAPGSAEVQDDDFYFAGTYPDPIGAVAQDEPFTNYDRAHTPGDPVNRIHFNLEGANAAADAQLRMSFALCCFGAADNGPSEHDLVFRLNGREFLSETGINGDRLIQETVVAGDYDVAAGANTIEIERSSGSDSSWVQYDYVRLEVAPGEVVAEPDPDVLVDIDATRLEPGVVTEVSNHGALGGVFTATGDPSVETLTTNGVSVNGITFDGDDFLQGPVSTPDLEGNGNPRSVEAWVFNPELAGEEAIISWGHRLGPDGSNFGFHSGNNGDFGAVGHWGAPDIGWNGAHVAGEWQHLVTTLDEAKQHRVYVNGEQVNEEDLSGFDMATHPGQPINLGAENVDAGGAEKAIFATLTLGKVRAHRRALSAEEIAATFLSERSTFLAVDDDGDGLSDDVEIALFGDLSQGPEDDFDEDGLTNEEEIKVYGTAANDADTDGDNFGDGAEVAAGTDPTNSGEFPVQPNKLVELNASRLAEGAIASWSNAGGLGGDFAGFGDPVVEVIDGVTAVSLDGDGDYFEGPASTPEIEGSSPRSIVAWVYNPELAGEETVISWGRRGGPEGTNLAFNHGSHEAFGAVGHWGAPDIGWNGDVKQGEWTHIAYTQNGSLTKVYTNGQLSNSEAVSVNTHGGMGILVGAQREGDGEAVTEGLKGSLSIADVRVFDGIMGDDDILTDYQAGIPLILGDSVADFGGPDVDNGWQYGYRNVPLDNRTEDYDPTADFIEFPDDWWNGTMWDEPNADGDNVPWTTLGAENSHPNGDNNGELHWTIRRWNSPGGPAEITWSVAKQNTNCGNGVTGAIHVNGMRIDSAILEGGDGLGVTKSLVLDLQAGDVVDLVHTPRGGDGTDADGCDGTFLSMVIKETTLEEPGLDILFLGANDAPDAGADANVAAFLAEQFGPIRYMNSNNTDGSETADVIVMSSTFGSGSVRGKFHNSSVPIVNWEEAVIDANTAGEFGQSVATMTKSTDTTQMALGDHPIAGAMAGTTIDFLTEAGAETLGSAELSGGTVAVGTAVGGAIDGMAMLFVTDAGGAVAEGAGVDGNVSPARRVAFPMTDATFDTVTDAGRELLVNSILWAAGQLGSDEGIPNLLGYWKFDGDTADSSGNGHDGTLTNGASLSDDIPAGSSGQSLQVSGGEQHVLVPHSDGLNATEAITIAAWVKPVGDMAWDGILAKSPSDGSGLNHAGNYELRIENGARFLHFLHQQGGADDTAFHQGTASIVPGDQWTHIAVTADATSGDVAFYINGELSETLSGVIAVDAFPTNSSPLYIGSRADLFTAMDGFIDDVALFGRALAADEIATVMEWNAGGGGDGGGGDGGGGAEYDLINVGLTANGVFTVAIPEGETADIEYSTDLQNWEVIATGVSGVLEETDAARLAAPEGYYRARP